MNHVSGYKLKLAILVSTKRRKAIVFSIAIVVNDSFLGRACFLISFFIINLSSDLFCQLTKDTKNISDQLEVDDVY